MRRFLKSPAALLISLAVLVALGFTISNLDQQAAAQTEEPAQQETGTEAERVITLQGHGEVNARPDRAVVRLGVRTEAESAAEALNQNNLRMQEVISATVEAGVSEDDIQTQGLRLSPIYSRGDDDGGDRTLTGFEAQNSISITIRNLDGLGELLDTVVNAGANTIEGIRFEVADIQTLRAEAREEAMNDAIDKAEQLTELAGAELGEVLTINETGVTPPPRPVALEAEAAAGAAQAVPVAPGTQTIEADLQVSWRIR